MMKKLFYISTGLFLLINFLCSFISPKGCAARESSSFYLRDSVLTDSVKTDSIKIDSFYSYKLYKKNAVATYYADKFNGRKTANGEIFDNQKYTAAHKKLPFGTKVRVTNEANEKSVIV